MLPATAARVIPSWHRVVSTSGRVLWAAPAENIHTTAALCGAPMKKKKRIDPALQKMQLDRKRKRLEKQIRLASRFAKKLKPIDECEIHRDIPKHSHLRTSEPDIEVQEEQVQRLKLRLEWTQYKAKQSRQITRKFDAMISAQEAALRELKLENLSLYELAVEKDVELLPYKFVGPCETPPIPGHLLDGNYTETTKSYELDPEIVKLMLDKNDRMRHQK